METLIVNALQSTPSLGIAVLLVYWARKDAAARVDDERLDKVRAFDLVEQNTRAITDLGAATREHTALVGDLLRLVRSQLGQDVIEGKPAR